MQAKASDTDELIRLAARGDESAFELLVRPHLQPGFRLAVTVLGDPTAAEDAVQEATFKAWRHLGRLRPGTAMRPWFLTVVANQCRSERRSRWWGVLRELERREEVIPAPDLSDWDLQRALLGLKSEDRAALFLRFYEDLSLAEVANVLGLSTTATRSRIHRALRRMRADLNAEVDQA